MTDMRWNQVVTWHDWYFLQYKKLGATQLEAALLEFSVDLRENPFYCDCNFYNAAKIVSSSFFKYATEKIDIKCTGPPELAGKVFLKDFIERQLVCNLTTNCPTGCLCQEIPAEDIFAVICSAGNLTSVPVTIPETSYTKVRLVLNDNKIATFNNVSYLNRITDLQMRNSGLNEMPDFVIAALAKQDKNNLRIDLRDNNLKSIPNSAQSVMYEHMLVSGNRLECHCDKLWMQEWVSRAPNYADKTLNCTFKGEVYEVLSLDRSMLECDNTDTLVLGLVLGAVLAIAVILAVTAKRCPYGTKVLIYKIFRIHVSKRYEIDKSADMTYDAYITFDDDNIHVIKWLQRVLYKQLQEKKPFYRLCNPVRDLAAGPETDAKLDLIEKSRRMIVILSAGFEKHRWYQDDLAYAERLDKNKGRVMFITFDKIAEADSKKEPLASKLKDRKVFSYNDYLLWSKLRYELPKRPCEKPVRNTDKFDTIEKDGNE